MKAFTAAIRAAATVAILTPLAQAQDVVLVPGYISGTVSVAGQTLTNSSSVSASGGGNSSNVQVINGSYTLTVNVPENSTLNYSVSANVYMDGNRDYMNLPSQTVSVPSGQTVTKNFQVTPGIVSGSVNVTGATLNYAYIYATGGSGATRTNARTQATNNGSYSFPVQPNSNIRFYGTAYMTNGQRVTLESKYANVAANGTATLNWDVVVESQTPASISGNIELIGAGQVDRYYAYASGPLFRNTNTTTNTYLLDDLLPGNYQVLGYVYLDNFRSYLQFPEADGNRNISVSAGDQITKDFVANATRVNGVITLTGSREWDSVTNAYIYARGDSNSPAALGYVQHRLNATNGVYSLPLPEGPWNSNYTQFNFSFRDNDPADYVNSSMSLTDYTAAPLTVVAGQTQNFVNYEYPIGTVTLNFSIQGGGELSSPRVSANCQLRDDNNQLIYQYYINAYGPSQATENGVVTAVGVPGNCTLTAYARVGGSQVTFGRSELEILPGTDIVVDIGGPSLNVTTPQPESYTTAANTTVSGTTTDDSGIADITINGNSISFSSTNNPSDPNEVSFSTQLTLAAGPNVITTVASDTTGKTATDSRTIYQDGAAPTLNWTPANGTITGNSSVVVSGTATDDNSITKVTVNGSEVSFASTSNPNDPNEVDFSTTVSVSLGDNPIQVTATDNSKRTTSQIHIVTVADNSAPIANAGADQDLECSGELTPATLDGSGSSDPDGDVLSYLWTGNNAALSGATVNVNLPLGTSDFTLAVDDGSLSDSDTVQITVSDTTAPSLTVSSNQLLEATTTEGAPFNIDIDSSDDCGDTDTTVTPDLNIFPLGLTSIEVSARDGSDNITVKTLSVEVQDTTAPVLTIPDDVIAEANAVLSSVTIGTATATDIFAVDIDNDAPAGFALGNTSVNWTATDANGNSSSGTQTVTVTDTTAPVLNVPADVAVEANAVLSSVDIGTATASDIFPVDISNDAPAGFGLGVTSVNWTATDSSGNDSTAAQQITVSDTTAPVLTLPADVTVEATGATTVVAIGEASATDIFAVIIDNDAPAEFPLGDNPVTWTATDTSDNAASGVQTVRVQDTTAPTLSVGQSTDTLWPPNHKMVLVATVSGIGDVVDTAPQVDITVSSNQPINGSGDGNTAPDWSVVQDGDNWQVWLRAERSGNTGPRVYDYTVSVTDFSGNTASHSGSATVPHDQGGDKKGKGKK